MAELTVGTFFWGSKYGPEYVERLQWGVRRHLKTPHRFRVFTPPPEDEALTRRPGCFARLRAFDPAWQAKNRIEGRLLVLDLDVVITGNIDHLVARPEPFVILQGVNAANPCPMNGSVWMLQAGYRPDVWSKFSLDAAAKLPAHEFPDDQGWFFDRMPDAGAYGAADGVYAFQKKGWGKGDALPADARLVAFPGWRDPGQFTHLPWVRDHWLG